MHHNYWVTTVSKVDQWPNVHQSHINLKWHAGSHQSGLKRGHCIGALTKSLVLYWQIYLQLLFRFSWWSNLSITETCSTCREDPTGCCKETRSSSHIRQCQVYLKDLCLALFSSHYILHLHLYLCHLADGLIFEFIWLEFIFIWPVCIWLSLVVFIIFF